MKFQDWDAVSQAFRIGENGQYPGIWHPGFANPGDEDMTYGSSRHELNTYWFRRFYQAAM